MANEWYYDNEGKQTGPIDKDTLQLLIEKRILTHKTLVWTEGMTEWTPAARIKGLVAVPPPMPSAAEPPPLPAKPAPSGSIPIKPQRPVTGKAMVPAASSHHPDRAAAAHGSQRGHRPPPRPQKSNAALFAAIGVVAVCGIGAGAYLYFKQDTKPVKPPASVAQKAPAPRKNPESASPQNAEEKEPTDPQQKRVWLIEQYDKKAKETPEAFASHLERIEAMALLYDDDRNWQVAVRQRRERLLETMEKKAQAIAEPIGKAAMKMINEFNYRGAVAELKKFPDELARTFSSNRMIFYRGEVEKISTEHFKDAAEKSNALLAKGDFNGALQALEKVAQYNGSRIERNVAVRREEILDAKTHGLNPSEGKVPQLAETQAYFKSDVYIGLEGMVKAYTHVMRTALMGNTGDALALADVKDHPRSAILYYARGVALTREGKSVEAAWSFDQARRLALPGNEMKSRLLSGDARLAEIDLDLNKAQKKCTEALAADPKNADANYVLGMMYALAANFTRENETQTVKQLMEGALDYMKRAAALDPDYLQFVEELKQADTPAKYQAKGAGGNPHMLSVVLITGTKGTGSGWCIQSTPTKAYVITNNHVIENQTGLQVTYQLELVGTLVKKTLTAVKVLKTDAEHDLALLEVQTETQIKALPMRQTITGLRVPMPVTLIGSPGAGERNLDFTVIPGSLSSLNRISGGTRKLQFDANADHGMSGGPVINEKGQVIGVIVSGYIGIRGQGFAIITEHVRDICKEAGINVELLED